MTGTVWEINIDGVWYTNASLAWEVTASAGTYTEASFYASLPVLEYFAIGGGANQNGSFRGELSLVNHWGTRNPTQLVIDNVTTKAGL